VFIRVGDLDQMLETNRLDETESKRAVAIKLLAASMMEPVSPVDIKKYGNRRLYNAATSAYEIGGECLAHRLCTPMSDIGRPITHHIVMSLQSGSQEKYGYGFATRVGRTT
jgi:hypothetical protein